MSSFAYNSQDGLIVIMSNPFENAKYYLDNFSMEQFAELETEKQLSLFFELNKIKFRIMDYLGFDTLSSETAETYLRTAKKFIKFLYPLQSITDSKEYEELYDLYKIEKKDIKTELKKELQKFEKELGTESITENKLEKNKKPTREETFALYFGIGLVACENLIKPLKGNKIETKQCVEFATQSPLFSYFIEKQTHTVNVIGMYLYQSIYETKRSKSIFNYGKFEKIYDELVKHYKDIKNIPNPVFRDLLIKKKNNLQNERNKFG